MCSNAIFTHYRRVDHIPLLLYMPGLPSSVLIKLCVLLSLVIIFFYADGEATIATIRAQLVLMMSHIA